MGLCGACRHVSAGDRRWLRTSGMAEEGGGGGGGSGLWEPGFTQKPSKSQELRPPRALRRAAAADIGLYYKQPELLDYPKFV